MSNPWFRAYADLIDDPKFIKLGPDLARALLMMWCVACQNDGRLPPLEDIAIKFRMTEARTTKVLDELRRSGWIDDDDTGLVPHNWTKRQYQSDVSTTRVKQFRERQRNVSSTVSETPPDTEQKQIQNRTDIRAVASATRPDEHFEEFWKSYPRRDGANPRKPAEKKFKAAVKSGVEAHAIIDAAKRYRSACEEKQHIGTPYVAQAVTWLNQQRWSDYPAAVNGTGPPHAQDPTLPSDAELRERYARRIPPDQKPEAAGVLHEGDGVHSREPIDGRAGVHRS